LYNYVTIHGAKNKMTRLSILKYFERNCEFFQELLDIYIYVDTICIVVPSGAYRTHTPLVQNYAAKSRPSTRQTSVNHYECQPITALYSLMMDRTRSETCWSDFEFCVF